MDRREPSMDVGRPVACRAGVPGRVARRGFTLVELLLAVSLGAMILVAVAASMQGAADQIKTVRASSSDVDLGSAMTRITETIRYGWIVESPSSSRVDVTDVYGNLTSFYKQGDDLVMLTPGGNTGTLLSGVASVNVRVATQPRYRDDGTTSSYGPWHTSNPTGTLTTLEIPAGASLALAFRPSSRAPASVNTVAGVEEKLLSSTLNRIAAPFSYSDASHKSFCHIHAIDEFGNRISPHSPNHPLSPSDPVLSIALHEARVPGDARPAGAAIGQISRTASQLAGAPHEWIDTTDGSPFMPPEVLYEVDYEQFKAKYKPSDYDKDGVAWGWWAKNPQIIPMFPIPTAAQLLDMSGIGFATGPGRSYTLVMTATHPYVPAQVRAYEVPDASTSGVAMRASASDPWVPLPVAVVFSLEGDRTFTQTAAQDLVTSATVTVTLQNAVTKTASAQVQSQVLAVDPWHGQTPGESVSLQLAGQ